MPGSGSSNVRPPSAMPSISAVEKTPTCTALSASSGKMPGAPAERLKLAGGAPARAASSLAKRPRSSPGCSRNTTCQPGARRATCSAISARRWPITPCETKSAWRGLRAMAASAWRVSSKWLAPITRGVTLPGSATLSVQKGP